MRFVNVSPYTTVLPGSSGGPSQIWKLSALNGEGVVGEQPILEPGEAFEYTSGAPLTTSSGFMTGSYRMRVMDGAYFDVEIPAFSLDIPTEDRKVH